MAVEKLHVISIYRSIHRRILYAPLDSLAKQNLLRILRHYFEKPVTIPQEYADSQQQIQYRYDLAQEYLVKLQKAFIHREQKPLSEILQLAFKSSIVNHGIYKVHWPAWFEYFRKCNNYDFINIWPITRLIKYGETLELKNEAFESQILPDAKPSLKRTSPVPKTGEELQLILKNVKQLYNFLQKSAGKIHKRGLSHFETFIPLNYTGTQLPFRRKRNLVLKKIKYVKDVVNILRPFNYKFFQHISDNIINKSISEQESLIENFSKIEQRNKVLKKDMLRFLDARLYQVHPCFDTHFLKEQYTQLLAKQYSIINENDFVYLEAFPYVKTGDKYLFENLLI